jgi:hypothetical protein
MKQCLKPLAVSLFLLGVIALPAMAESADQGTDQRMQRLERQANQLQDELKSMKSQLSSSHKKSAKHKHKKSVTTATATTEVNNAAAADDYAVPAHTAGAYIASSHAFPIDSDVPGKSFVSTGPYIGVPFVYSGGDLIINNPSVNQDVALLNIRKAIRTKLTALGRSDEADHAHLLLSGIIEGQASYRKPGNGSTQSDVDLSSAELDGYVLGPSNWTSGLIAFSYDDAAGTSEGSFGNNSRTQNSRVYLNKAFITIGDFTRSPLYGTIGQMYVPFGTYGTNMISSPLTKILGRTKARAIVVGFQQQSENALYAAGYAFRGDTYAGATSRLDNGGVNVGYRYAIGHSIHGDFGGGVIANLADSVGMQNNGNSAPLFGGFGASGNGNENIAHRVPAMNFRGQFSIGDHIDLLAEYVGAINSFSRNDLTANSHGAKPQALNAEAAYTFSAFERPSSVALGYGKSKDALALGLPAQRYSLAFNTSWWKNTLQSIELRHDINYGAGNYATGTSTGTGAAGATQAITGSGRSDNMITAQIDIYF